MIHSSESELPTLNVSRGSAGTPPDPLWQGLLLASISDAVLVTDLDGVIRYANAAVEPLLGWMPEELIGRPMTDRYPLHARAEIEEMMRQIAGGQAFEGDFQDYRKDGGRVWIHARVHRFMDAAGNPAGIIGVSRDVTERRKTEEELRGASAEAAERHRELRAVLDRMSDGLAFADAHGHLILMNRAGLRMHELDSTPEARAAMGQDWFEATTPDGELIPVEQWPIARAVRGETFEGVEIQVLNRRSGRRWVGRYSASLVRDEVDGSLKLAVVTFQDITEVKRVERLALEQAQRLKFVLSAVELGMWDLDLKTGLIARSPRHDEIFGYSEPRAQWRIEDLLEHVAAEDRHGVEECFQAERMTAGECRCECRIRRADGQVRWIAVQGRLWNAPGSESARVVGTIADITDRKHAEQQHRRQAEGLARSNKALQEFAWVASHDLKEPLRGIRTIAAHLRETHAGPLGTDGQARVEQMIRLSDRLAQLVDALLEFSKLGRGGLQRQPAELRTLATQAVESLSSLLLRERAKVELETPLPQVECDPVLVRQVFSNLISNAVKYNDAAAKRVWIGAKGSAFYVRDNGIGIDPRQQERIFTMFRRLHLPERYGGGAGVGLATVQRIVEMHGGRVWVDSQPGGGSTFWVTLQAEAEET